MVVNTPLLFIQITILLRDLLLVISGLIRRDAGRLAKKAFTSNHIVSLKQ